MTGRLDEKTKGDFGGCIDVSAVEELEDDEDPLEEAGEGSCCVVDDELSLREMDRRSGPVSGKDGRCLEEDGRGGLPPRDLGRLEKIGSSALLTLTLLLLFWFLLFRLLLLVVSDVGVLAAEAEALAAVAVEEMEDASPPGS